jgi:ribosomal protein L14
MLILLLELLIIQVFVQAKCIHIYRRSFGLPGDVALFVIRRVLPHKKLKKGDKLKGLIVSTSKHFLRCSRAVFIKAKKNKFIFLKKGDVVPFSNRFIN